MPSPWQVLRERRQGLPRPGVRRYRTDPNELRTISDPDARQGAAHDRRQGLLLPADGQRPVVADPVAAVVLLRRPAHRRVPHRPGPGRRAAAGPAGAGRRGSRRRRAHLGRLAVLLVLAGGTARPGPVAVQGGLRRRPLLASRARRTRAASSSGSTRTSPSAAASTRAIRRSSARCGRPGRIRSPRPRPQIAAGGAFGATLAAGDRRLAEAVLTLREESETNGFVNGHPMAHHRVFPGIAAGAPDAYAELIESGASEFEAGPAWTGRRRTAAVRLPHRGAGSAARRRDHRRLLPPGRRGVERRRARWRRSPS